MNTLSVVADGVISLRGFLVFLILGLVVLWWRPASRGPRVALTLVVMLYAVLAMPIVSVLGERLVAGRYQTFVATGGDDVRAIVLLGAGAETVRGLDPDLQLGLLNDVGALRTIEAARLYRLLHEPWIVSSGGSRNPHEASSAVAMQEALVRLGVKSDRILLEARSTTTREEAVLIAPVLRTLHAERFVLVTSRNHMARSEAVFRAQGLSPIPATVPGGTIERARLPRFLGPSAQGLAWSNALFHEMIGWMYYWWRGWI